VIYPGSFFATFLEFPDLLGFLDFLDFLVNRGHIEKAASIDDSHWIDGFLPEVCCFPNSPHDDQLDAVSLAVQMLEHRKHVVLGF
jgi:hypothetical protein